MVRLHHGGQNKKTLLMGKCKNCGKELKYCGDDSPMLKNDIWNHIVSFYNLESYEKNAFKDFMIAYKKWKRGNDKFNDKDEYHLYLCTDCMEKALGRKLLKSDLVGENVSFNKNFEKRYF